MIGPRTLIRLVSSARWDAAVLLALTLTTPVLLISVNIQRGARVTAPLILAAVVGLLGLAAAASVYRWVGASKAFILAGLGVVIFYEWNDLAGIPDQEDLGFIPGWTIPVVLGVVLTSVVFRLRTTREIRLVALAFAAGSFIVAVPSIVLWTVGEDAPRVGVALLPIAEPTGADVVVLVLDGYGRADVLADLYDFDNSSFLRRLESHSFVIADQARANYSMTIASLSSALSMEYTVPSGVQPSHRGERALQEAIGGSNSFMQSLKSAGYDVVHLESGWDGSRCGEAVMYCIRSSWYDEMAGILLNTTPLGGVTRSNLGHPFTHNGLRVLDGLGPVMAQPSARPRVIFAHVTLPHGPFFLDAECMINFVPERAGGSVGAHTLSDSVRSDRRSFYIDQVQCVNSRVSALLEFLDDDAVMLIVGDHGPDSAGQPTTAAVDWTERDALERMSVLAALRGPRDCQIQVYPGITLVNLFRLTLRCVGASDVEFLDDLSYVYPHLPGASDVEGNLLKTTPVSIDDR